jgi:hypothetical protein
MLEDLRLPASDFSARLCGFCYSADDACRSPRPRGGKTFEAARALLPLRDRESSHLFRARAARLHATEALDEEDAEGRTLLWHAAYHNDLNAAVCLLKFGRPDLILEPDYVHRCVDIKILRRVRAEPSRRPPRHRRDACSMAWRCRFLAA